MYCSFHGNKYEALLSEQPIYLSSWQKTLSTNYLSITRVHRQTKRISRAHLLYTTIHRKCLREAEQQPAVTPKGNDYHCNKDGQWGLYNGWSCKEPLRPSGPTSAQAGAPRAGCQVAVELLLGRDSTTSLGNLCHCFGTCTEVPVFQFVPVALLFMSIEHVSFIFFNFKTLSSLNHFSGFLDRWKQQIYSWRNNYFQHKHGNNHPSIKNQIRVMDYREEPL